MCCLQIAGGDCSSPRLRRKHKHRMRLREPQISKKTRAHSLQYYNSDTQIREAFLIFDLQLLFKMFTPISAAKTLILIMFSFTLDTYCTSVRPGRGIPHMWLSLRFLLSFYLLKGFFSSFSLLLLRVKGRGCHSLLKPDETNCDL